MTSSRPLAALLAALLLSAAGCSADDDTEAIGPPPSESVEGAEFFQDPGQFAGDRITIAAEIDEILNPDAFTLVPNPEADDVKVLVVHPGDIDVEVGSPVEVTGTLVEDFDPPSVQPFRDVFAQDPAFQQFVGAPYLEADAIDKTPVEEQFDPNDA